MATELKGGAQVTEVEILPLVPEVPETEATVNVVTTALGTLGPEGLVEVGTKATIPISAYSANWMRPASAVDARKVAKKA